VGLARQAERSETTRGALVAAARDCFVEQGFDATSTESVLARAGVSKGALYHHFASKAELLAAVFEAVSRETVARAQNAGGGAGSSLAGLAAALKAWLRAVLAPEPRRIILETGPAVLGLARARQIEEAITQAPLRHSIERAIKDGEAQCADVDLVARLLSAAVSELALTALQRRLVGAQLGLLDTHIDAVLDALLPAEAPGQGRNRPF
jgi:AcrR family transcriptional regulator